MLRQPDGTLQLIIEPELELLRSGYGHSTTTENVSRITGWLERTIRLHPDQWNWMNVHWRQESTPVGSKQQLEVSTW
jgi:lauroyl/myristoyl acyltransferase